MDVPLNSAQSLSRRMHPPRAMSLGCSSIFDRWRLQLLLLMLPPLILLMLSLLFMEVLKEGDIHTPFHGRLGSASVESLGTTKLLERPKSTILKLRSEAVVPVRTTLDGFTSRWTMPTSCIAFSSGSITSATRYTASATDNLRGAVFAGDAAIEEDDPACCCFSATARD